MAYDLTGQQQIVLRGGGGLFFDRPSGNSVIAQVQQPAGIAERHRALRAAADARQRRPDDRERRRRSTRVPVRRHAAVVDAVERRRADGAAVGDVARRRVRRPARLQHRSRTVEHQRASTSARRSCRRTRIRRSRQHDARRDGASSTDLMRAFRGYSAITHDVQRGWRTYPLAAAVASTAASATASRSASTTRSASRRRAAPTPRLQHNADGSFVVPRRPGAGRRAARADNTPQRAHDEGELRVGSAGPARAGRRRCKAIGFVVNDWQLSGVWTGRDRQRLHRRLQLPERRRQREPDRLARLRGAHPHRRRSGTGCSSDVVPAVQHRGVPGPARRQRRPRVGRRATCAAASRACSTVDRAQHPARRRAEPVQLRVDMFNAPNAAGVTPATRR